MLRAVALLLTVLTGFSGLVYQVAWQKYLATLLGSHSEATCAVLGIFLGGLSLGYALFGALARRLVDGAPARGERAGLLFAYGVVEAAIGAYALLFPWIFEGARALSLAFPHEPELLAFALDVGLTVLLIGPPTVLMGGTIPLLTQGLSRGVQDATRFHSLVYGFNTAGAFVGALAAGFVLVPRLGLAHTVAAMGVVNLVAGGVFLALRGAELRAAPEPAPAAIGGHLPDGFAACAAVALLAGFAMMTLQTALNRVGALALGASHFTFAMVVAAFVLCISLGSFAVSLLRTVPRGLVALTQWTLAAFLLLAYSALENAPYFAHLLRLQLEGAELATFHAAVFACLLGLAALPLGLSGALLPLLFHELRRAHSDLGDTAGRLYAWNTAGSLLGALVGGYLLLFWVDLHVSYRLATLGVAIGAAILTARTARRGPLLAGAGLAAAALALVALPPWSAERLSSGLFRSPLPAEAFVGGADAYFERAANGWADGERLRFHSDDPAMTVAVFATREPGLRRGLTVATNGKSDGNTPADDATMVMAALLPALLAEETRRAFVIGWGTGITVGELAALDETEEVVVAEISHGVMEAAPLFEPYNRGALASEKTRVVRRDAYRALLRSAGRFDVIVSEPSNPWTTGVEMLYSLEFLRAARDRLSPGGIYAQWFHTYETDDETVALVLRTYREVFDEVAVWRARPTDLLLLGFADAGRAPDLDALEARFARPDLRAQLGALGIESLPQLLAHELLPLGVLERLELAGPLHTILHPILSDLAARAFYRREVGHPPVGLSREAALAGARSSWLARYRAARGLSEHERAAVVEEVCRLDLSHCATFFAAWQREAPGSPALAAALASARSRERTAPAVSPGLLERLAALYGPDATAHIPPSFELARDLRRIYEKYYHHAAPFPASSLHAAWERCAARDERCARELPRVQGLGLAPPLLTQQPPL
ncbi:MAG: fused MFS/spermidine synthase [Myxococcota bacterium]|nr:fused MFS/spermidine synthase [Myxococcota bacterium]